MMPLMRGRASPWVLLAALVSLVLLLLSICSNRGGREGFDQGRGNSCDVYLNELQTNKPQKYNELIDRITKTTRSPDGSVFQNRCHEIREMRRDCGLAMCSKPIVSSMCYDVCKDMQVVVADWRLATINKIKTEYKQYADMKYYSKRYDIGFDIRFNIKNNNTKITYDELNKIDQNLVDLKLRMVIENFSFYFSILYLYHYFYLLDDQNTFIPYYHLKNNGDLRTIDDNFNVTYRCLECNIFNYFKNNFPIKLELSNYNDKSLYEKSTRTNQDSDPYWTNAHKFHVGGVEYTIELTDFTIEEIKYQPVLDKEGKPIEGLNYNIDTCRNSNVNQNDGKNVQYRDARCANDNPYFWKEDAKRVEWAIGCNAIWPDCGFTEDYVNSKIKCADSCPDGWTRAPGKCEKSKDTNGGICEEDSFLMADRPTLDNKELYARKCKLKWSDVCKLDYDPMQEFNTSCAFSCPTIYVGNPNSDLQIYPYTLSQDKGEYKCIKPTITNTDTNLANEPFKEGPVLTIGNESSNKDWLDTANSSRPSDAKYEYKWCQCN